MQPHVISHFHGWTKEGLVRLKNCFIYYLFKGCLVYSRTPYIHID